MPTHDSRTTGEKEAISLKTSLAGQMADRIREELIRRGKPGDRIPSGRALAERLGVGRNTIYRALDQLTKEGWLKRLAGRGRVMTRPRKRPVRTSGMLFPFDAARLVTEPFNREIFIGISQAADEAGRHLLSLFGTCRRMTKLGHSTLWSPDMRTVDSLITLEIFDTELIAQAASMFPVVSVDLSCKLPNVSSAALDHEASIRMAFKYLLDLGHRRIGFLGRISSKRDPAVGERLAAYRRAFEWASLPADPKWVFRADYDHRVRQPLAAWPQLPADRRPTALIVVDLFWRLADQLLSAGVKIPGDLSLVNIDTISAWSDWLHCAWADRVPNPLDVATTAERRPPFTNYPPVPTLVRPTTVELPARSMGRWAMEELVRRLADPAADPRHQLFAPTLAVGTTAAPPADL